MLPESFQLLVRELSSPEVLVSMIGIFAACAFAAVFAAKLGEKILPRPQESRVADFLPFERLMEDGKTLQCRDGTLVQVLRMQGADLAFAEGNVRMMMLEARKRWVDSLSDFGCEVRVFSIRDRVEMDHSITHVNPLLRRVAMTWAANLDRVFKNSHYVVLAIAPRKNALRDLNAAVQGLQAILSEYEPELMYESAAAENTQSPLYLFARIASPLTMPTPVARDLNGAALNDLLTADHIHFTKEEGVIRYYAGEREKLGITMGLRGAPDAMDEQMVSDILSIDAEVIVLHNFLPISRPRAMAELMQQQRMARVTSFSGNVMAQYQEALELIDSSDQNYQTIVNYALTVFAFGATREEIKFAESEVERICRLYGATPVREGFVTQASFFAQFPTYVKYPRMYRFMSRAVACAVSLEQAPQGFEKSDWGPGPISVFRTLTGTAYKWQFHVSTEANAVAHCVVIGPTGQGKTTLLAFLAGQAMRHNDLRVYFFDRHRGVEIFTHAIGGSYVTFEGAQDGEANASMNPFQCTDTKENRAFLRRWLKAISMVDDALAEKEIGRAVVTNFDYLKPEERNLKNLYKACFSPNGLMRRELFRWVNEQQYGNVFNAGQDTLDLSSRFIAFDFTHIFEDETLAPAVISYIMHRIQSVTGATGDPSLIMIDETAPMLKHPMFKDYFVIGLQEGRKKRQAYLCAFQQPNIIDKLGLGEVIRGQCQSVIFFRNPQAMEEDYENWKLTAREMAFIQGRAYRDLKYAILLSRPAIGESIILDVDLGGLGPYLKLYSSGRKHVLLAEELRRQWGPDKYIDKYLEVA